MVLCHNKYLIIFSITLIFAAGCGFNSTAETNNRKTELIGWLHGNCFAVKTSKLIPGTKLWIIDPDDNKNMEEAEIVIKTSSSYKCPALTTDRKITNLNNGFSFYEIESKLDLNFAIGIVGMENKDYIRGKTLDYCMTTEGITFFVKNAPQAGSSLYWQGYYYLGYDSEPSCH